MCRAHRRRAGDACDDTEERVSITVSPRWVCHSDALQVSDLPGRLSKAVSLGLSGQRPGEKVSRDGKSKTCRASAWQSQGASGLARLEMRLVIALVRVFPPRSRVNPQSRRSQHLALPFPCEARPPSSRRQIQCFAAFICFTPKFVDRHVTCSVVPKRGGKPCLKKFKPSISCITSQLRSSWSSGTGRRKAS